MSGCLNIAWVFVIISTFGETVVGRTMSKEEWISVGEEIIASHVKALNARDVEALLKGYTEDIHRFAPGRDIDVGLTAVMKDFSDLMTSGTWPSNMKMKVTDVLAYWNEGALLEFQELATFTGENNNRIKGMLLVVNVNGDFKIAAHIFNHSR